MKRHAIRWRGFTLVELLVVIAIIGVLIALLVPAVQAARESARRKTCMNQLRQLTMAVLLHEGSQKHFPTGGWGWEYAGDPDKGFGAKQPGGWVYNILPYLEQSAVHDLGQGLGGQEKLAATARLIETLVPGLICPTRRAERLFPHQGSPFNGQIVNAGPYTVSTRIDYAINVGVVHDLECEELRDTHPEGEDDGNDDNDTATVVEIRCDTSKFDGISFYFSRIGPEQITDGLSHTYALGEKYLNPNDYETGTDEGDNESAYSGVNADQYRTTSAEYPLVPDELHRKNKYAFGSSHGSGFHMATCDGAVEFVGFDINPEIHAGRGTRNRGE
jgi:prepilin-type N-terminal cleavage/methylation domain-containing protein